MNGNNNKTLRTMKNKIISIIQALVLLWGVTSCHSPEELGSDIQREGINSITASFPNDDSSENSFKGEIDYTNHSITFVFPYNYQHGYDLGIQIEKIEYCIGHSMKNNRPIFNYIKIMQEHADKVFRAVLDQLL